MIAKGLPPLRLCAPTGRRARRQRDMGRYGEIWGDMGRYTDRKTSTPPRHAMARGSSGPLTLAASETGNRADTSCHTDHPSPVLSVAPRTRSVATKLISAPPAAAKLSPAG